MLNAATVSLVDHAVRNTTFIGNDRFWYIDSENAMPRMIVADARRRTKTFAYDSVRMVTALHAAGWAETDPKRLLPERFDQVNNKQTAKITIGGKQYDCALDSTYHCSPERTTVPAKTGHYDASLAVLSPDGKRAVFIHDWNLWMRDILTGTEKQLTTDGVKDYGYATENAGWAHSDRTIVVWSPDSRMVATFQQDQRKTGEMYTVTTNIGHPHLNTWKYPLVGDKDVTTIERVLIDDEYLHDIGINAIPDQISGINELAERYPWIDRDRVGMWGHSGGGNATLATMLRYPDFIKVGIAESGNHENRNYEDDWDEKWVGLLQTNPDGTSNYDSQANASFAKNLKGKLLLAHGMLDDNVPVSTTLLLVDALEKASKDFDLGSFRKRTTGTETGQRT
jgi:hypothetical protein